MNLKYVLQLQSLLLFGIFNKGFTSIDIVSFQYTIYVSTDKRGYLAELIPAFDPSALHFPFTLSTTKSLEYMGLVDL
jgi:hypothetical protein